MITTVKPTTQYNLSYKGSVLTTAVLLSSRVIVLSANKSVVIEKYSVTKHTTVDKRTVTQDIFYMDKADLAAYREARQTLATK